jgi:GTPase
MDKIFPPEDEYTNIEYKRRLPKVCSDCKLAQLSAQMIRRIYNGIDVHNKAKAIYYLGVNDNGTIANVKEIDITESIDTLYFVAKYNGSTIRKTKITKYNKGFVGKVVITRCRVSQQDIRICLLGSTQVGKTTILSVLASNFPDNGKGSARKNMFNYKREVVKGVTSSIKQENIYFNGRNRLFSEDNYSVQDMVGNSDKIVTIIDTPGCIKYTKQTIRAMFSHHPDHNFIVYDQGENIEEVKKYIKISKFLEIPYTILITKIDLKEGEKYFDENTMYLNNLTLDGYLELNTCIYNILPKTREQKQQINSSDVKFIVNDIVQNNGYGIIVDGVLINGFIQNGDKLLIGPNKDEFTEIKIKTIHKKLSPCDTISIYDDASMLITLHNKNFKINKGMTIFSQNMLTLFKSEFYFKIEDEFEPLIEKNAKLMIFISNMYEKVRVVKKIVSDGIYIYKCNIHKNNKMILEAGEKIGVRFNSSIIEAVIINLS